MIDISSALCCPCSATQFVVSRINYEIRIRKLLREGENSGERDGMHVAKRMRKREVRHLRPISMMNEIKEHA